MNPKKLFDLSGKVVVLTGASGFLGSKYAEGLAQAGANVVLADIKYSNCKKLENELSRKYSAEIMSLKLDVTNKKSIKNLVTKVKQKFHKIDVLINNAVFHETPKDRKIPFEDFPLQTWNKIIEVNTTGVFLCCQEIGRLMKKQKNGIIINVSSIYGLVGADQRIYGKSGLNSSIAYAVTKSSLLNLTRYLASYWSNYGIRVNTLSLGGVKNNQDPSFVKNYSYRTMLGRMAEKDDYIGPMLFLASDASSYMNGANLIVDGGWTAW